LEIIVYKIFDILLSIKISAVCLEGRNSRKAIFILSREAWSHRLWAALLEGTEQRSGLQLVWSELKQYDDSALNLWRIRELGVSGTMQGQPSVYKL